MDPLTLPPGVTVGPLDPATGSRTIYRHGMEIGTVSYEADLGPETAETCYTITAAGSAYRYGYGPMMVAVCAVAALTS